MICFFPTSRKVCVAVALVAAVVDAPVAVSSVLVEAHRGASNLAPENTNASINAATGIADLTEFDVRVTADGKLVLMHDSTVNRTTNGSGSLSSLTLAQVKALDAGSWFSPAFAGEQVPTMSEAISFANSVGIQPLIERKAGTPQTYHDEFLSTGLASTDFRLISFDWSFLAGMDILNTDYNLGALGGGVLDLADINTALALGVDFLAWSHSSINQATVDLVHANGMELHVWTVNSSSRMQQLIDFGVDGITTDLPDTLQQLVIQSSLTADINSDGVVNEADWQQYNATLGMAFSGMSLEEARDLGDFDGDLDNDVSDFVKFKNLYLAAAGSTAFDTLEGVPEPTAALLAVSSFALLHGFCRTQSRVRCNRDRVHYSRV